MKKLILSKFISLIYKKIKYFCYITFDMTATTAIPEAVLTGFYYKRGVSLFLHKSGIAEIISANLGNLLHPFFLDISFLSCINKYFKQKLELN